jgi:chromosome segregation ATPase
MAKIMELEVVTRSEADKIVELEATCADLKRGKDKLTDGYRRLAEKHKSLEQDKSKLVEAHVAELTKLCDDLDVEMCSSTKYCQDVRRQLHELHEAVASSFDEVKAQCMLLPDKGIKVEEIIH